MQFLWLDRETGIISAIVTVIHNTRFDTSGGVILVILATLDARRCGNGSMKRKCGTSKNKRVRHGEEVPFVYPSHGSLGESDTVKILHHDTTHCIRFKLCN
jgi:hypothetical protein